MKTDIEIAQEAVMEPIKNVAARCGISEDDLELYGKYKAKISDEYINSVKDNEDGKLILVTAINPTPAGEGKTTITVGLGEAFGKLGKKAVIALREPSLGPCFGIKGGAAGGGYAQVVPMEELNLHFTGDFHAITSANNLCAALLDNHIQQGNELGIDPRCVTWKRCSLTEIVIRAGVCDTDEAFAAFAKGAARNADDLLLIKQAVAELDAAQAEAADVGKDIERAVLY